MPGLILSTPRRGISCLPSRKREIVALVESLEQKNPTEKPNTKTELLCGTWKLLFTTALDVLSLGVVPGVQVGEVYQNITLPGTGDSCDLVLYNVVELEPFIAPITNSIGGDTMSQVEVKANGTIEGEMRVNITFVRSGIAARRFLGFDVPSSLPKLEAPLRSPVGWIDTTFLDKDMRIARAPGDNVFVLVRVTT